jgi:methylenetetrahydrofolate dehydrogenase (NADP+)/methenyltetrahydrofolate cyclohydrolase
MIISGRDLALLREDTLRKRVALLGEKGVLPHLAIIQVGKNSASEIYVHMKSQAGKNLGIKVTQYAKDDCEKLEDIQSLINKLNQDTSVHGIILQLPLPKKFEKNSLIHLIDPQKDVDGLHPYNQGLLSENSTDGFVPATPLGCLYMLKSVEHLLKGRHALVIGRSVLVGRPMAQVLLNHDFTVTIAHSHTQNLQKQCGEADMIISATGIPHLIQKGWPSPDAIILDVGIHRCDDGSLKGDVDFDGVINQVRALTPVPGGVGPMTVSCLLENTILAAERAMK